MASITCPSCNHHPVSDQAAACPRCGHPIATSPVNASQQSADPSSIYRERETLIESILDENNKKIAYLKRTSPDYPNASVEVFSLNHLTKLIDIAGEWIEELNFCYREGQDLFTVRELRRLPRLKSLKMQFDPITDEILLEISKMSTLRWLEISSAEKENVSSRGWMRLTSLQGLEFAKLDRGRLLLDYRENKELKETLKQHLPNTIFDF